MAAERSPSDDAFHEAVRQWHYRIGAKALFRNPSIETVEAGRW